MNRRYELQVLERGWLSSNNIVVGGADEATVIDTGYVSHAEQTETLVREALRGRHLQRIVNTHLHSDHCGGNVRLQRAFGCEICIPPGQWDAVARWDTDALTYAPTGQRCERFHADRQLVPGGALEMGGRAWSVLAAPGHDPHSVILFDTLDATLVSADALWENGFGVVFPELEGAHGFEDVSTTLDLIAGLEPRLVIPGHGRPFCDVGPAIERARRRLDALAAEPARHARHAAKVLLKFRVLETQREMLSGLLEWAESLDYMQLIHRRHFAAEARSEWIASLLDEMCASGALRREGSWIDNR